MSIDLTKNIENIQQVYNDVISDKTSTDWALFGYEGQTNILKVVGSGDGGLEELGEDLNSTKIMYGILKVIDPNTTRTKLVFINWQGEAAPNLRKGICSRHLIDIQKVLKGFHVTINARTEEDMETDCIFDALRKASATTYNFSDRLEISDRIAPVGTNYKRTNPLSEINQLSRNKFWEAQEEEERKRKEEEYHRKHEELQRLEKERKEREARDAKHREVLGRERDARILAEKNAEAAAMQKVMQHDSAAVAAWQKEMEDQQQEEMRRAARAEECRNLRKKEAQNLIGHNTSERRRLFEIKGESQDEKKELQHAPQRVLKEFMPATNENGLLKKKDENINVIGNVNRMWPPQSSSSDTASCVTNNHDVSRGNFSTSINENNSAMVVHPAPQAPEKSHSYDASIAEVTNKVNEMTSDPSTQHELNNEHGTASSRAMVFEVDGVEYQILEEHGLCATALYDYQAADETEITFDPGEIITNIEQIDEGWWQGIGPDGTFGLFPANYVELINASVVEA